MADHLRCRLPSTVHRRTVRPRFADVVLPLPLEQTFTYRVPEEVASEIAVGMRVLVPFGPRRLTGLVTALQREEPDVNFRIKSLIDLLDAEPAFSPKLLKLTKWMAEYYVCGWGEAVRAALPAGTDVKSTHRIERTDRPAGEWADHPTGGAVLGYLEGRGPVTLAGVRQAVGAVPLSLVRRMAREDVISLETEIDDPTVGVKTVHHLRFAPAFQHRSAPAELVEELRGHKQIAVIETIAGWRREGLREPRRSDVMERADASASTIRSLLEKGIIEQVEREALRSPLEELPEPPPPPDHELHGAQREALDQISEPIRKKRYGTFLLHGVTGSGKTEVYIAALKQTIEQGRTGIILVPEIALTPQTVQRFRSHFPGRVAVFHSRMSLGERYDTWRQLRDGHFDVVIGPRSAVLAPLRDVGLIVVDEEHESSYKQFDPSPRYHARDVAVMRAFQSHAVCILGSATPSLESLQNARWGKYELLEMGERVPVNGGSAALLPEVEVVDLTLEKKKHQLEGTLSKRLRSAIRDRLDRKEQVILLQNRRGYAPVIECDDCGWAPECPDCAVTMTYHKAKRHLRCHYCGRAMRMPRRCPGCQHDSLAQIGTGTQRVEEELQALFPEAGIARMDLDTTSGKGAHHEILHRFGQGVDDILLGTQMVAKGLDFSRVTLVGVVDADTGLLLPDFRSEERSFQLLTQVAGRAGRAEHPGEVILQTRQPDHPVIQFAREHDYAAFAEFALDERRALGYPPFGHLAGVEFRGPNQSRVEAIAKQWTAAIPLTDGLEVLGPEPALIGRVKKQYRYHTLVKATRPGIDMQRILRAARDAEGAPPNGYHVSIDVDAVSLF